MFRIEGLKRLSYKKFEQQLQQHWISDMFPDCIREVYLTSNNTDLNTTRKAVIDSVASHKQELVPKRSFQELIREARRDRERAEKAVVRFYDEAGKEGDSFAMTAKTAREVTALF
ncbi:hypothetical protein BJ875DRAFT_437765 [Amylocarpus encephaloides]|uniref:Uncharacterized protein n=1 Tax=Amylocarpus encephaloides TaxID=45428 RepID=A0A9P7YR67_9HELO|nr:hypothetical protein BJ875DRAFT_437765 [Amylocarpus encephaloides]